jgi:hypothetical protein
MMLSPNNHGVNIILSKTNQGELKMHIINLDLPNATKRCQFVFNKLTSGEVFRVFSVKKYPRLNHNVYFREDGQIQVVIGNNAYGPSMIYDIIAYQAGELAECECYWYEEPEKDSLADVDQRCEAYFEEYGERSLSALPAWLRSKVIADMEV